MKKNLEKVEQLGKVMDLENFYVITTWKHDEIALQGHFNLGVVRRARKLGFVGGINENGNVELHRDEYKISLT